MHCYIICTDTDDPCTPVNVVSTLDAARSWVRAMPAYLRPSTYVELRDMPTDKDTLILLLRDRLAGTVNFPDKVGPLMRRWGVSTRGALIEEELS